MQYINVALLSSLFKEQILQRKISAHHALRDIYIVLNVNLPSQLLLCIDTSL